VKFKSFKDEDEILKAFVDWGTTKHRLARKE
jgi:hypothetical protein